MSVRAKKHLGQHFLRDKQIAEKIADSIQGTYDYILEVGPGTGALTFPLLERYPDQLHVIDVDKESIAWLKENLPLPHDRILEADFLKMDLEARFDAPLAVIGNFPYNISSQILFKAYDNRNLVPEVAGMFQKEVAERIAEPPGSKRYGIISVLLQTYYDIEYLFTVHEHVFDPPPKVKSGVIRLTRNDRKELPCDEKLFTRVVKMAFNQRRKTMRNSLKALLNERDLDKSYEVLNQRPEQLSVEDFISLTQWIYEAPQNQT